MTEVQIAVHQDRERISSAIDRRIQKLQARARRLPWTDREQRHLQDRISDLRAAKRDVLEEEIAA